MTVSPHHSSPMELGNREWIALPEFGIKRMEARIDTGAAISALHAEDIDVFKRAGKRWVRFNTRVSKRKGSKTRQLEAPLYSMREVTSSNGMATRRHVIQAELNIGNYQWPILISLIDRSAMKYRMLLGRISMGDWCVVRPHGKRLQDRPEFYEPEQLTDELFAQGSMFDDKK